MAKPSEGFLRDLIRAIRIALSLDDGREGDSGGEFETYRGNNPVGNGRYEQGPEAGREVDSVFLEWNDTLMSDGATDGTISGDQSSSDSGEQNYSYDPDQGGSSTSEPDHSSAPEDGGGGSSEGSGGGEDGAGGEEGSGDSKGGGGGGEMGWEGGDESPGALGIRRLRKRAPYSTTSKVAPGLRGYGHADSDEQTGWGGDSPRAMGDGDEEGAGKGGLSRKRKAGAGQGPTYDPTRRLSELDNTDGWGGDNPRVYGAAAAAGVAKADPMAAWLFDGVIDARIGR